MNTENKPHVRRGRGVGDTLEFPFVNIAFVCQGFIVNIGSTNREYILIYSLRSFSQAQKPLCLKGLFKRFRTINKKQ